MAGPLPASAHRSGRCRRATACAPRPGHCAASGRGRAGTPQSRRRQDTAGSLVFGPSFPSITNSTPCKPAYGVSPSAASTGPASAPSFMTSAIAHTMPHPGQRTCPASRVSVRAHGAASADPVATIAATRPQTALDDACGGTPAAATRRAVSKKPAQPEPKTWSPVGPFDRVGHVLPRRRATRRRGKAGAGHGGASGSAKPSTSDSVPHPGQTTRTYPELAEGNSHIARPARCPANATQASA
jgi:hypothetical protein